MELVYGIPCAGDPERDIVGAGAEKGGVEMGLDVVGGVARERGRPDSSGPKSFIQSEGDSLGLLS